MPALKSLEVRTLTVGPWQENCYLILDPLHRQGLLVDPGDEAERIRVWVGQIAVQRILLTHAHIDHVGAVQALRQVYSAAPVGLHPADRDLAAQSGVAPDFDLNDGDVFPLGDQEIRVAFTPGHTPGSVCLHFGGRDLGRALVGDSIFPGGPGHTNTPLVLDQLLRALQQTVFTWPDATELLPGHGAPTTVGRERKGFTALLARATQPGLPELFGDVTWETK